MSDTAKDNDIRAALGTWSDAELKLYAAAPACEDGKLKAIAEMLRRLIDRTWDPGLTRLTKSQFLDLILCSGIAANSTTSRHSRISITVLCTCAEPWRALPLEHDSAGDEILGAASRALSGERVSLDLGSFGTWEMEAA